MLQYPTTPDLVLLSRLSERAMHGYEANAELEWRAPALRRLRPHLGR